MGRFTRQCRRQLTFSPTLSGTAYAVILINIKHTGSSIPQLTVPTVKTISIPIAPLPEQQAIVAKIEELLSELDNG
ncbi:MAG: restriction endonuclease subunit S [Methylovulum sp.]|nr:restriction endonuclease subunit S [Methylovulum sp.]